MPSCLERVVLLLGSRKLPSADVLKVYDTICKWNKLTQSIENGKSPTLITGSIVVTN